MNDERLIWEAYENNSLDKEYYNAYKAMNTEIAQKMVDDYAQKNGYVEVFRASRNGAPHLIPRNNYILSFTTKKEVADSYGIKDEDTKRFFINAKITKEFPSKDGSFSFTGFDNMVRNGGVVVTRNVVDSGPFASTERDPEYLFSSRSDIYGTINSSFVKSAEPFLHDDEGNLIPLSKRFI
jgi:hypothetical protein